MNYLFTAIMAALLSSSSAFACQPPRDLPLGAKEAAQYWQDARDRIDKERLATLPTLMVAKVSLVGLVEGLPPPDEDIAASLTPIMVLQGPSQTTAEHVNVHSLCNHFPVRVGNGVYLLGMRGTRIGVAVALTEGQEQAGVAAYFKRLGEPNPWQ